MSSAAGRSCSPCSRRYWRGAAEGGPQLGPGGDAELGVGAGQVVLYSALSDEERLCDLPVGAARGGALGDAQLAPGERVAAADGVPAGPAARGHQLVPGAAG